MKRAAIDWQWRCDLFFKCDNHLRYSGAMTEHLLWSVESLAVMTTDQTPPVSPDQAID